MRRGSPSSTEHNIDSKRGAGGAAGIPASWGGPAREERHREEGWTRVRGAGQRRCRLRLTGCRRGRSGSEEGRDGRRRSMRFMSKNGSVAASRDEGDGLVRGSPAWIGREPRQRNELELREAIHGGAAKTTEREQRERERERKRPEGETEGKQGRRRARGKRPVLVACGRRRRGDEQKRVKTVTSIQIRSSAAKGCGRLGAVHVGSLLGRRIRDLAVQIGGRWRRWLVEWIRERCYVQVNEKATTAKNWKTPGALVSGRYNTPPLQEDLFLRSRMAPESSGRGREEVKQFREKNTTAMIKVENIPLEKRNKEHHENPVVERYEKRVAMGKKYMRALRMKRDVQGMIRINYDNIPVGNGRQ
ncbi:hypothetical protein TRIUR3_35094 [Triticum urartu]|uniref:Uncharacterized protein n=1 Tax=Triticum urartu TaxID=4572 RepID=M7Z7E4_TRIUA|nr:hypothetical protein TRIUR3_35094 [Triticum urartu]